MNQPVLVGKGGFFYVLFSRPDHGAGLRRPYWHAESLRHPFGVIPFPAPRRRDGVHRPFLRHQPVAELLLWHRHAAESSSLAQSGHPGHRHAAHPLHGLWYDPPGPGCADPQRPASFPGPDRFQSLHRHLDEPPGHLRRHNAPRRLPHHPACYRSHDVPDGRPHGLGPMVPFPHGLRRRIPPRHNAPPSCAPSTSFAAPSSCCTVST